MQKCSNTGCLNTAAYGQTFCSTTCEIEHQDVRPLLHRAAIPAPPMGTACPDDEPLESDDPLPFDLLLTQLRTSPNETLPQDERMKLTNPKDAIGSNKLPLHLWPETATLMGTLGLLDGALKYGRGNYRAIGVRATIYIDACKRHLNAWLEGEECAPDSGVPHLAHALACLAIIVDAEAAGQLNDDRQFPGGYHALVEKLTPHVARLKDLHKDKSPQHYTIADGGSK